MTVNRDALAAWGRLGWLTAYSTDRRVQLVGTTGGRRYILKQEIAAPRHLDLLRHLHDQGVPVPIPLPTDDGHAVAMVEERFYTLTTALPSDDRPPDWSDIGAALGRFHRAAATFAGPAPARMDLSRHPDLAELPKQPIHGDCHLGNILTVGGKVTGFVDFDDVRQGPRLYDLAYLLAGRPHEEIPSTAARLVAGYHAENPLTVAEREAMVPAMLAVELIFMDWFGIRAPAISGLRSATATYEWIIRHQDRLHGLEPPTE